MNRITKFLSYITTCLVFTVGAVCESRADSTFSVTTTNSTTSFDFCLTAVGTFTVDCGDGGTLTSSVSPTDVSNGTTITRNNTTVAKYTCTWGSAGAHTILFDGTATNYNTSTSTAAISFYVGADDTAKAANAAKVASISGNLSAIFPYISGNAANGAQPRFYNTFEYATNLTSIPATLFADYTTASTSMFYETFRGCTGLTTLPSGLFFPNAQSVSGANYMFYYTFYGCTGLTSLPSGLFFPNAQSVSGANYMFYYTFYGCTGLTSLPSDLFSKITSGASNMFYRTFNGCTGLTSLPSGLFFPNAQSVSGAVGMFYSTFQGCTGLTSLPSDLFSKITSGATEMFRSTFYGCTGLTSLPSDLFSKITSGASGMFHSTFDHCTGLTSLPSGLFFPNAQSVSGELEMFNFTFKGCRSLTSIPENLFSKITSGANNMFNSTFYNCTGLTTLPSDLFSNISSNATYMFRATFSGCTNLGCATEGCSTGTGYIPSTMFAGITPRSSIATNTMLNTFSGTKLVTTCPVGTIQYTTGWESYWGDNKVSCVPGCPVGQYSPSGSTSCSTCTANSFCPGFAATLDSSVAQGITACSTLGDNSYTQSIAGSDEDTDCYRSCSGNVTIAHATTITGNDYYGVGTDTCAATVCDNGYHVDTGACIGNEITINWHGALQSDIETNNAGTMIYGGDIRTPVRPDPAQIPIGQRFKGWRFRKPTQN